jgi:hypothetical protein
MNMIELAVYPVLFAQVAQFLSICDEFRLKNNLFEHMLIAGTDYFYI